jgi:C1A family cysteine protease
MTKYNLIRDAADDRDLLQYFANPKYQELPERVSLVQKEVFSQGDVGSCTAQSIALMIRNFLPIKISRLFQYYNCRVMDGTVDVDGGTTLRQAMKALNRYGMCNEAYWLYYQKAWNIKPPNDAYQDATGYIGKFEYKRLAQDTDALKTHLAVNAKPFVFGFIIYSNFDTQNFTRNNVMPQPYGKIMGGHAVTCIGYNDNLQCFIVQNSWGKDWGVNGTFLMPYKIMENKDVCFDLWAITNILPKEINKNDTTNTNNIERNEPKHCKLADLFGRFKNRIAAMLYH